MCTGFVWNGSDRIVGYNLDLGLGVWDYDVYAKKDKFYVGIKVGSTIYKTHGVTRDGDYAVLPYMNGEPAEKLRRGQNVQRVDLLANNFLSGKISFDEAARIAREKEIVNIPAASMHVLISDRAGRAILVEPGLGYRETEDRYFVVSNFPLIDPPSDLSAPWFGKERYDRANEILRGSGDDFSVRDALALLREVRQEGKWATRLSFAYSQRENAVYYVRNNDFDNVTRHAFA